MGFRQGAYAKVWSVEDKGNYSVCRMSTSKKNKETEEYETDFQDGYVRFVGTAHTMIHDKNIPNNGLSIKLSSVEVTNKYDKASNKSYINYAVFGFELPDGESAKPKKNEDTYVTDGDLGEDDDLPF